MEILGTVEGIIYRNEQNGYSVIEFCEDDTEVCLIAVGNLCIADVGERLLLIGDWVEHKQYGRQFKVETATVLPKSDLKSIEKYLAGGTIKGIGEFTAKELVKRFGLDTFRVIEEEPERLTEVVGIGKIKAAMIHDSFVQQAALRDVMLALQEFDITINQSLKIYSIYGPNCVNVIKTNPYKLIEDVENIGFITADKIAKSAGIEHESEFRIQAGIRYMLELASQEGHTYLPKHLLIEATVKKLNISEEKINRVIDKLIIEGKLSTLTIEGEQAVFLPKMRYYESDLAKRLLQISRSRVRRVDFNTESEIQRLEATLGIELAPLQKQAIEAILTQSAAVITGGPGTGKTTILKLAIKIMERYGLTYELAAPTGRAAKRMSAATGVNARTIHRLLEYNFHENGFMRNQDFPLEADIVIIDEMSMVDCMLMDSLLKAISGNTRLIMVGDADQLPSVGAGNVLQDIINSNIITCIRLKDIYRQAGRSMIVTNAHRINNGQPPIMNSNEEDFKFDNIINQEDCLKRIVQICVQKRDENVDCQVLAPMKKGVLGVQNINACLQKALNPPSQDKKECVFGNSLYREGDKVMQIKNNYSLEWQKTVEFGVIEKGAGVFNGDIGTITNIDSKHQRMEITFDDGAVAEYDFSQLEEVELAYCISIHKSQGSEFDMVLIPILGGPPMFMTRNLLYTAVTRAKKQVYILGSRNHVNYMAANNNQRRRYTALKHLLTTYESVIR